MIQVSFGRKTLFLDNNIRRQVLVKVDWLDVLAKYGFEKQKPRMAILYITARADRAHVNRTSSLKSKKISVLLSNVNTGMTKPATSREKKNCLLNLSLHSTAR